MKNHDPSQIRTELASLSERDPDRKAFGSRHHQYQLLPPLTEEEVHEAETQYQCRFPDDYRRFLLELGAGGAGPFYGVFPLLHGDGGWSWDGDGGSMTCQDLSEPIPHSDAWNLGGHEIWDQYPDDEDYEDETEWDDDYEEWRAEFEELYWDLAHTTGAICICHEGCALRDWLVVTGPCAGEVWHDGRVDDGGLSPWQTEEGARMSFLDWYGRWLNKVNQFLSGDDVCW